MSQTDRDLRAELVRELRARFNPRLTTQVSTGEPSAGEGDLIYTLDCVVDEAIVRRRFHVLVMEELDDRGHCPSCGSLDYQGTAWVNNRTGLANWDEGPAEGFCPACEAHHEPCYCNEPDEHVRELDEATP